MANELRVKVLLDDEGSINFTEKSLQKLAAALQKTGKSTLAVDRALKGTAGIAPTATKNFAKMSQTIGGALVPAYATLAANVFAATAAFNFLKEAGQLRLLEETQVAYANNTGIALRTLSQDLIRATGNQIKFQEASQAAAIGTAAGVQAEQLEKLGTIAKSTAALLGRDVPDSFNRLIRGVTKAEPELLDELGIVLRLNDAVEEYKKQFEIVGRELTTFEKTQAVANFTIKEGERVIGNLGDSTEGAVNGFILFQKSFDDLLNTLKSGITIIEPFFAFLAQNPLASLGITLPLISAALSDVTTKVKDTATNFAKTTAEASNFARGYADDLRNRAIVAQRELTQEQERAFFASKRAAKTAKEAVKDLQDVTVGGRTGFVKLTQGGKLAEKTLERLRDKALEGAGDFAKLTEEQRILVAEAAEDRLIAQTRVIEATDKLEKEQANKRSNRLKSFKAQSKATFASLKASAASFAVSFAAGLNQALIILSAVSLAFELLIPDSVKDELKRFLGFIDSLDKDTQNTINRLKELNTELRDLGSNIEKAADLKGPTEAIKVLGNAISSIGVEDLLFSLEKVATLDYSAVDLQNQLKGMNSEVERLNKLQDEASFWGGEAIGIYQQIEKINLKRTAVQDKLNKLTEVNNEQLSTFLETFSNVESAAKSVLDSTEGNSQSANSLVNAFNLVRQAQDEGKNLTEEQREEIEKSVTGFLRLSGIINNIDNSIKKATDSFKSLADKERVTSPFTAVRGALEDVRQEFIAIKKDQKDQAELTDTQQQQFDLVVDRLEFIKSLEQDRINLKTGQINAETAILNIANNRDMLTKADIASNQRALQLRKAASKVEDKNLEISELIRKNADEELNISAQDYQNRLNRLQAERALSVAQLARLARTQAFQIAQEAFQNRILGLEREQTDRRRELLESTVGVRDSLTEQIRGQEELNSLATNQFKLEEELTRLKDVNNRASDEAIAAKQAEIELLKEERRIRAEILERDANRKAAIQALDNQALKNQIAFLRNSKNLSPLQKKRFDSLRAIQKLDEKSLKASQEILNLEQENARLENEKRAGYQSQIDANNSLIEGERLKLALLQEQKGAQQEALTFVNQFSSEFKSSLESNLQGTFASIIKNEETSMRDALLNLAKGVLESLADFMAQKLTEGITNFLFKPEPPQSLVLGAEAVKKSIESGAEAIKTAGRSAANSLSNAVIGLEARIKVQCCDSASPGPGPGPGPEEAPTLLPGPGDSTVQAADAASAGAAGAINAAAPRPQITPDVAPPDLEAASATRNPFAKAFTGLKSIFGNFKDSIGKLFAKDGGFLSGLGDIFKGGLDGFGSLFKSIGGALGGLFGGGGGGGGGLGSLLKIGLSFIPGLGGLFGAQMGGIYQGGISAFAKGGVVKRPTVGLVGEGGQNEAVVPLPDGKAIPVNMNGTNNNNNVSVNLNMATGQGETTGNSENLAQFGNSIVDIVQREIADQTRPGGLLAR